MKGADVVKISKFGFLLILSKCVASISCLNFQRIKSVVKI